MTKIGDTILIVIISIILISVYAWGFVNSIPGPFSWDYSALSIADYQKIISYAAPTIPILFLYAYCVFNFISYKEKRSVLKDILAAEVLSIVAFILGVGSQLIHGYYSVAINLLAFILGILIAYLFLPSVKKGLMYAVLASGLVNPIIGAWVVFLHQLAFASSSKFRSNSEQRFPPLSLQTKRRA